MNFHVPTATYRLQFHAGFRFADGRDLIPYLSELGITDLYSSPYYKARRGSSHGYDIANPLRINSELGTEEDFDEMAARLRHYGMGLLLDTVPNHMAASYENPWWTDVLENGPSSAFAAYFDIDWNPATTKAAALQQNRVLLPILGELYGKVLENRELSLKFEDTGIHVRYFERRLPLDPKSYLEILERCPAMPEVEEVANALERLPSRNETATERILERRREKDRLKELLWRAYHGNPEVKHCIDEALVSIETSPADLDRLLSAQAYRLAYWKIGYEEINYRRFFDINELVGLRVEVPEVFDNRHRKTLDLVRSGKVTGLRIDHIDGLWDPGCYLKRLTNAAGGVYTVVEKILGREEPLPETWPVSGTTGYEFLNAVNGIFIQPEGLARMQETYSRVTGNYLPFAELVYECNKLVMDRLFTGDVNALVHHLGALAAGHRQARDIRLTELSEALVEVTACLPVYRTYIHNFEISERDRRYLEHTLDLARRRTAPSRISDDAFAFLRCVLLLEPPDYLAERKREWLDFVMRWQQFSGPVMAKGLEDTANYRYNVLLSLNEVGGDPLRDRPPCDLAEFHRFNSRRAEEWPGGLNATATHDTKRGEDVRARLNVLTEMPEEWERRLTRWMEWNAPRRVAVNGVLAPSASEEILIYQTLAGAWPRAEEEGEFADRVREFLLKALREAKQNSSWLEPREEYERAAQEFVSRILAAESDFLPDFREFQRVLARHGALNSLGQLLLKIAAPGVPDFYQGCELWELNLVDPDNRRPVDYERRAGLLENLRRRETADPIELIRDLTRDVTREEIKLWVTYKALDARKRYREVFAEGEYIPLAAHGAMAGHVIAFARRLQDKSVVAIAPRWTATLGDWADTTLDLPATEWQNALTGLIHTTSELAELLAEFPLALLVTM